MSKTKLTQFRFVSNARPKDELSYAFTTVQQIINWANENMTPSVVKYFLYSQRDENCVYANYSAFAARADVKDNNPSKSRTRYLPQNSASYEALEAEGLTSETELVNCPSLGADKYLRLVPIGLATAFLESVFTATSVYKSATVLVHVDNPFEALLEPDKPCNPAQRSTTQHNDEQDIGIQQQDVGIRTAHAKQPPKTTCSLNKYKVNIGKEFTDKLESKFIIFSLSKAKPGVLIVRAGTDAYYSASFYKGKTCESIFPVTSAQQVEFFGHEVENGKYEMSWDDTAKRLYIDFNKKVVN